ncbi:MAG: c-type cytochrome [Vulcanimicrobiaceae bacterium]
MIRQLALVFVISSLALAAACSGSPSNSKTSAAVAASPAAAQTFDPQALPAGAMGELIAYGHKIITDTPHTMKGYATADMSCDACHVNAGYAPRGGSLVGVYAQFPQWNKRAHRIIALQDRLAECFLYSMNGRPPAYNSREMEALVAYVAYLSRDSKVGATPDPAVRLARFDPPQEPDLKRGAQVYAQQCASCHQANGEGVHGSFPPLWGSKSFNDGAGMHRLYTMAGFVRYSMPQNAPGSLTDQQAYDVSAYVLSHARPHFRKSRTISFPPQQASYF